MPRDALMPASGKFHMKFVQMADFKNLEVFKKAYALSLETHRAATKIRGAEYLSLKSQMIRAANSIPANIVEGRGQKSQKEFARYIGIAINSASELEFHLMLANDLGVLTRTAHESLLSRLIQVRMMLSGLRNAVRGDLPKPLEENRKRRGEKDEKP